MEKYPSWPKGLPWKGSRSGEPARGFKSLFLRSTLAVTQLMFEPSQSNIWQLNRNATLNIFLKEDRDRSFKNGLLQKINCTAVNFRIIQNEPNQANYGADLDVNVWTVTVLNLNPRFPGDGSLTIINMRVWSWLRMNAGGVPNTCKSNGDFVSAES